MNNHERATLRTAIDERKRQREGLPDNSPVTGIETTFRIETETKHCIRFREDTGSVDFGNGAFYLSKAAFARLGCPTQILLSVADARVPNFPPVS